MMVPLLRHTPASGIRWFPAASHPSERKELIVEALSKRGRENHGIQVGRVRVSAVNPTPLLLSLRDKEPLVQRYAELVQRYVELRAPKDSVAIQTKFEGCFPAEISNAYLMH